MVSESTRSVLSVTLTAKLEKHPLSPPTGELSLEEFVAGARSDEDFMEVMIKSLDLSHIVAMIHNRRHSV